MGLKKNQLIDFIIKGIRDINGNELTISGFFTTEMYPLLSTATKVVQLIGSYIDGIEEDIINQLILKYSDLLLNLTICDTNSEAWQVIAQQWVTLSVSIDLLYNSPLYKQDVSGKVYKKLGDFAISKDSGGNDDSSPLASLIKKLECELFKIDLAAKKCMAPLPSCEGLDEKLLNQLMIDRSHSNLIIKGAYDPNRPLFGRTFRLNGNIPSITHTERYYRRKIFTNER